MFALMGEPQRHVHTYQARQPEGTVLYKVLAEHIETFIAQRETDGKGLPEFVVKELRGYLRCGILQYGFLRTKCKACDFERAVPFSCKGRGFCPSCCGKRMAEKAYHLLDHVLPDTPYRQWVLSLPIPLRFWMATNKKLTSKVHQIASKEITAYYVSAAKSKGIENPLPGSITFIQRFGSACNLNTHFHLIALEGVYYALPHTEEASLKFVAFGPPTDQQVCDVVKKIATKTIQWLRKKGYLQEEGEEVPRPDLDPLFRDHPAMAEAMAASIQSKIAFGERAGDKVRRVGPGFGYEEETPLVKGTLVATINGFNLHAKVGVAAHARDRLLQLIKYVTRPPVSNERLSRKENGDLLYELKTPWSDGATAILLSPEELCEKMAALVPPPNSHLTRYSGVFSSRSKWRNKVVPCPEKRTGFCPDGGADRKLVKNHRWAKLLARTFKVDVGSCPKCGEDMEIMGAVQDSTEVQRYLRHIGISEHSPPIAAARYVQPEFGFDDCAFQDTFSE
jgi:hypothetical protein